jgi:predicted esterase
MGLVMNRMIIDHGNNPTTAILFLPGKGGDVISLAFFYKEEQHRLLVGVTPNNYEWYPTPNGPHDQENAVRGCEDAIPFIFDEIVHIERQYGIPPEKIAIVGFSAGGVMAIQAAAHIKNRLLGAIVSHSGTILDPNRLPHCKNPEIPIFLTHNRDDSVFTWKERYLPARLVLQKKEYCVLTCEGKTGGHKITDYQLRRAKNFIRYNLSKKT